MLGCYHPSRVPHAIAFPRQSGDWLGFPYEDWEIPGSSLVVTERFWTCQNKVVSKKDARTGYLLLRFLPETPVQKYKDQNDSYKIVYHGLTAQNAFQPPTMTVSTLETIFEESENLQDDEDMDISADERVPDEDEDEEGTYRTTEPRNDEEEPLENSIMIERSTIESSISGAQISGTGDLPRLDAIDPALLTFPPSGVDFYEPTCFNIPTLHYPDNNL